MDELRNVLHDLKLHLNEAIGRAHRASYLARQMGLFEVDQQIEHDLSPALVAFADDDLTAPQRGSVGQLLALLQEDA